MRRNRGGGRVDWNSPDRCEITSEFPGNGRVTAWITARVTERAGNIAAAVLQGQVGMGNADVQSLVYTRLSAEFARIVSTVQVDEVGASALVNRVENGGICNTRDTVLLQRMERARVRLEELSRRSPVFLDFLVEGFDRRRLVYEASLAVLSVPGTFHFASAIVYPRPVVQRAASAIAPIRKWFHMTGKIAVCPEDVGRLIDAIRGLRVSSGLDTADAWVSSAQSDVA